MMSTPRPPIYRDFPGLLVHAEEVMRSFARCRKYKMGADSRNQLILQTAWNMQNVETDNLEVTKMKASQLVALSLACLLGIMPVAASARPFVVSADGLEVTDQNTGLIWRRCPEGMVVSGGTCTGTPTEFSHEAAMARAKEEASLTSVAWRLPNIKELSSLTDKRLGNPAIDSTAFPSTSTANYFWSASPVANLAVNAWGVYFNSGTIAYSSRTCFGAYVLLVRSGL